MWLRSSRGEDLDALRSFIDRCSAETLYRRFHGAAQRAMERELRRIACPTHGHRSWVAVSGGEVRGTATLATSSRLGTTEMALVVEDGWFRRGVGRALVDRLRAHAQSAGVDAVTAWVQADNERALRFIRAVAPEASIRFVGGAALEVRIPIVADGSPSSQLPASPSSVRERRAA